ncbi:MAG: hypothetical protein OXF01_04725, partial [Gemmatimonadetes bacterium]|nr:hypothetical protein [Gemmatimonadota bacterium]
VLSVQQGAEEVETLGVPVKLSETPASVERGAPGQGAHTAEVLRQYGFGEEEIAELRRTGAVSD